MLYRSMGRTGAQISALGVGGHHLGDLPTVDEAIRLVHEAIDGGITFFDEAKQQGKVRFVGFTGHKSPAIHLKMLAHNNPFDAVQLPLNCFDGTYRTFEHQVLPEFERRSIAALGMKSLGGGGEPILHGVVTAEEALRYAMSLPSATTISGMESLDVLRQNLMIVRGFKPMPPQGNAGAPRAVQVLCRRRSPRAVQIDQEIRRWSRPRAAWLSTVGTAPALSRKVHR